MGVGSVAVVAGTLPIVLGTRSVESGAVSPVINAPPLTEDVGVSAVLESDRSMIVAIVVCEVGVAFAVRFPLALTIFSEADTCGSMYVFQ